MNIFDIIGPVMAGLSSFLLTNRSNPTKINLYEQRR